MNILCNPEVADRAQDPKLVSSYGTRIYAATSQQKNAPTGPGVLTQIR